MNKILLVALAGSMAFATAVCAQTYPQSGHPITFIVPSSAGGGTDVATRLIAPLMEKDLGTTIVTIDKPGASMQIGLSYVVGSKPDGYTIAALVLPTAASIYLDPQRTSSFERKNLTPIGMYYGAPFAIIVAANSPYKTLKDFVDAAKAAPGKLNGGTSGFMATGHFALLAFAKGTNTTLTPVHYQGGGPALTALLGGQTEVAFNSVGELLAQKKAGTIRLLAVMSDKRDQFVPDVPTVAEAGYPDVEPIGSDIGFAAPAGTSPEIIARLSASLKKAMEDPTLKERMAAFGNTLNYLDPPQYSQFWDKIDTRFKPLVETARKQGE